MTGIARKTRAVEAIAPDAVPYDELMAAERPVILKGLVRDWPLARAASPDAAVACLKSFYRGQPVVAFIGRPEHQGRFGYTADATLISNSSRATGQYRMPPTTLPSDRPTRMASAGFALNDLNRRPWWPVDRPPTARHTMCLLGASATPFPPDGTSAERRRAGRVLTMANIAPLLSVFRDALAVGEVT
jgi:hypothetical protein